MTTRTPDYHKDYILGVSRTLQLRDVERILKYLMPHGILPGPLVWNLPLPLQEFYKKVWEKAKEPQFAKRIVIGVMRIIESPSSNEVATQTAVVLFALLDCFLRPFRGIQDPNAIYLLPVKSKTPPQKKPQKPQKTQKTQKTRKTPSTKQKVEATIKERALAEEKEKSTLPSSS